MEAAAAVAGFALAGLLALAVVRRQARRDLQDAVEDVMEVLDMEWCGCGHCWVERGRQARCHGWMHSAGRCQPLHDHLV